MSGFSLQFNPRPPPPHDAGILNGDTKATLVAWGDDITFLDRDEDNGRGTWSITWSLKRASSLRFAFLSHFSTRRGEENLRFAQDY